MICNKKRFKKDLYCSSDFRYVVKLYKQHLLNQSISTKIDATNKILYEFDLSCSVETDNYDIEAGGELALSTSNIKLITYYQNRPLFLNSTITLHDDIKSNCGSWFIKHLGHKYQIQDIEPVNSLKLYCNIRAKRVA